MLSAELLGKDRFAEKERTADKKEQQEEDGDTKPDVLYADDPGCIHRMPRFSGNVRKVSNDCFLIASSEVFGAIDRLCAAGTVALRDWLYINIK